MQQQKKLKTTFKHTSKPQHDLKMCEIDQYSVSYNEYKDKKDKERCKRDDLL